MVQTCSPLDVMGVSRYLRIVVGIIIVGAGLVLPHVWPIRHFRLFVFQAVVIAIGSGLALRALIGSASPRPIPTAQATRIVVILAAVLLAVAMPFLISQTIRATYRTPIGTFNEGWNLLHTSRFLHGKPLYPPFTADLPITPQNYPPLSFVVLGVAGYLTEAPLVTGRMIVILSFLCVAYLVYRIIDNLSGSRPAAALGAVFWLALILVRSGYRFPLYDPHGLGLVFSVGALYLYSKCLDHLTIARIWALALLCCLALFVKFSFVAVPLALTLEIFLRNRRHAMAFVLAGAMVFLLFMLASRMRFGPDLFPNLLVELGRQRENYFISGEIQHRFLSLFGFVLLEVFIILLVVVAHRRTARLAMIYVLTSFAAGSYFVGGFGVGDNAWFDLFVSGTIALGVAVAELTRQDFGARWVLYGLLACAALPLMWSLKVDLGPALDHQAFGRDEQIYLRDLDLFRSMTGPALFETTLLGFDAHKEFLFDPFFGSQLMLTGRYPESVLTDRIRRHYFSVIVLEFDLDNELARFRTLRTLPLPSMAVTVSRWTDNTVLAIGQNYDLLDPQRSHRYTPCYKDQCPFFYVPRKSPVR